MSVFCVARSISFSPYSATPPPERLFPLPLTCKLGPPVLPSIVVRATSGGGGYLSANAQQTGRRSFPPLQPSRHVRPLKVPVVYTVRSRTPVLFVGDVLGVGCLCMCVRSGQSCLGGSKNCTFFEYLPDGLSSTAQPHDALPVPHTAVPGYNRVAQRPQLLAGRNHPQIIVPWLSWPRLARWWHTGRGFGPLAKVGSPFQVRLE